MDTTAHAYGIAIIRDLKMGPPIVEYLQRIDDTLTPYGGRFIVHGARPQAIEGEDPGTIVILEFPDRAHAEDWYASEAYQQILPLRTENSASTVFIVDGVGPDHVASSLVR